VVAGRHFKIYDPIPLDDEDKKGIRTFEQTLIPQDTNALAIASVSFSYFDPGTGTYKTLRRGPFRLSFHSRQAPAPRQPFRPTKVTAPGTRDTSTQVRVRSGLPTVLAESSARRRSGRVLFNLCLAGLVLTAGAACVSGVVVVRCAAQNQSPRLGLSVLAAALAGLAVFAWQTASVRARLARPRCVAARDAKARLAPGPGALTTFDLPAGSAVDVLETYAGWAKVSVGKKSGWVPAEVLRGEPSPRVYR
jgi:hypothetical protein